MVTYARDPSEVALTQWGVLPTATVAATAPVLVSMFYTSCDMVCPMIFETVHATLRALPPAERAATRVLLVSFDPEHDTVPVLKKTYAQRQCNAQWTLARTDDATARKVAAVLGIQYRKLSNGEFNHSSTIELLDKQGRIVAKTGKLGAPKTYNWDIPAGTASPSA